MEKLRDTILQSIPRALGQVDRNPGSSTYGCCDRYYWHYKLHDISNARFQEICLLLALVYENGFEGNAFYKNARVLDWMIAIMEFWASRLSKDGSAVEIYPFERSFCATSFSCFTVTETLNILLKSDEEAIKKTKALINRAGLVEKLRRVGTWIRENPNRVVANQMAAAINSLVNIGQLSQESSFDSAADEFFALMRSDVEKYGYTLEYGGLDIGYQSITNSCFAWYMNKRGASEDIKETIEKLSGVLEQRIDELGNYDFSSTSRCTQFLYLYGFFVVKSSVLGKVLKGMDKNSVMTPLWLDDRYSAAMATDYSKVYIEFIKQEGKGG